MSSKILIKTGYTDNKNGTVTVEIKGYEVVINVNELKIESIIKAVRSIKIQFNKE